MIEKEKIIITSAVRSAVGSLGKSLKNISSENLGSKVILKALEKSKIKKDEVDEIILGQVLTGGSGQNPARQAAIKSGISVEKPAYIVNQVCGSGLRSVASAFQSIKCKDSKIVVAGGQENMSLAPHVIHLRDGKKLGDAKLIDTMINDGLWDAFNGYHMGITAENVADAIIELLGPMKKWVKTLTADNGKEFAFHERIAKALNAKFYFAHPYSSWERGLNENTNGLIRQYLPKKTDFKKVTQKQIDNVMEKLNNRPRKCLGFKTPNQVFFGINPTVALQS